MPFLLSIWLIKPNFRLVLVVQLGHCIKPKFTHLMFFNESEKVTWSCCLGCPTWPLSIIKIYIFYFFQWVWENHLSASSWSSNLATFQKQKWNFFFINYDKTTCSHRPGRPTWPLHKIKICNFFFQWISVLLLNSGQVGRPEKNVYIFFPQKYFLDFQKMPC